MSTHTNGPNEKGAALEEHNPLLDLATEQVDNVEVPTIGSGNFRAVKYALCRAVSEHNAVLKLTHGHRRAGRVPPVVYVVSRSLWDQAMVESPEAAPEGSKVYQLPKSTEMQTQLSASILPDVRKGFHIHVGAHKGYGGEGWDVTFTPDAWARDYVLPLL